MWLATSFVALLAAAKQTSAESSPPNSTLPFPDAFYPGYADDSTSSGARFNQTSPAKYPSPWTQGLATWADAYARAQDFVKQLTLAEKVNLTTGSGWETERCVGQVGAIPRLGFRSLCMQDSPVGVRDTDYNSVFPAGGTIAATFDRQLMYQRGFDMGSEHKMKGVDVQLGPVVGPLGRSPEGGRNWEGFSPDPALSGIAVAETIRGIQDAGVMACTKHYIGNEQEHFRQVSEATQYGFNISNTVSSNVDDVTMHELYLWPFADAVRAGTASIMCSYNQINNSYGCQNSYTLNHLLKGELGFQGFVMSDWGAQQSGASAALAGMDMAMPGDTAFDSGESYWGTNLTIAVLNGTVPEWRINDMATRIVAGWYYVGRDKNEVDINFDSWTTDTMGYRNYIAQADRRVVNEHVNVRGGHGQEIRNMAARATVLLKNTNNSLPLTGKEKFIGVFGEDAGNNIQGPNGCTDRGCDNGTLAMAWGSGSANFPYLVTPLTAIQNQVLTRTEGLVQGITDNYGAGSQIEELASQIDRAIVFVNSDSGEGYISVDGNEGDRNNLTLWQNGETIINNVSSICNNTVVVVHSTGPVLVDSWYDNPNISAILWAGVPGEQSGNSIVDVLYGNVNPGAKLPFTIGATRKDYGTDLLYKPNNNHSAPQVNFAEGVFIDYRAFDRHQTTPTYEFGYGLSYTTFAFSDLRVAAHEVGPYTPSIGMTQGAPTFGQAGQASDYVFPQGFSREQYYIYPYLNSTDLRKSSGGMSYGEDFLPPGTADASPQPVLAAGGAPGGNPQLYDVLFTVYATVTNTGPVAGDEVPQLYISLGGPDDPVVQLRGFERLSIQPGESATFAADLTRRDVSNWDSAKQNWVISQYDKTVHVGNSSRKLPLSQILPKVNGDGAVQASGNAMPSATAAADS